MAEQKIISRNYLLCMGMNFCAGLNFFILAVSVAGFALATFHVSESEAGLAVGIYVIGGLVGRFALGKYIELFGRKRMLLVMLAFAVLASLLYNCAGSFAGLCAVRLVHGMAYGLAYACITSIVSKAIPPQRRGEGMGYYYLSTTVAMCIGPLLGLYFSNNENYEFVFTAGVALYSLAFILAIFLKADEEHLTDEQVKRAKSFNVHDMLELSAIPLAFASMLLFLSYSVIYSFIGPYADSVGLGDSALFFYLAVAAGTVISRLTGKYYDIEGANKLLLPAFVSYIIGMALFATMHSAAQMYVSGILIGLGYSMLFTVGMTAAVSRVEAHRYGVTTSTYSSLLDIGTGCGPMVLGFLIPLVGYDGMYAVGTCIAVVSLVVYWFVFGKKYGNIPGKDQQRVSW